MNRTTSRTRKFVYTGIILLLVVPIAWLGMPATGGPGFKGKISDLRQDYKLGEATLGNVDPTSATMNLVLLGMRGIAGSMLWTQADEEKRTKNWSQLESTVESIIKLQPRFMGVWKYQAWNLGYNVSAECDAVEDRFFWVKKGAKFLLRGIDQNQDAAELYHDTGTFMGKKIGNSDERDQFRRFFKADPDPRFEGLPDPDLNEGTKDNYQVAKDWYELANEKELLPGVEQHLMARPLFRSYPWRSQLDFAMAIERDGIFGEAAQEAWTLGHTEWREKYGREPFLTPGGAVEFEASVEEIRRMAESDGVDPEVKLHWQDRYHKMTNYPYWRNRSQVEMQPDMITARRVLKEGKTRFFAADLEQARELFEDGLNKLESLMQRYPKLTDDEVVEVSLTEDVLKSILMWQYVLHLNGEEVPQEFPMKELWDKNAGLRQDLDAAFQAKMGTSGN